MLLNVQMLRAIAAFLVVFVHLEPLAHMAGLPADSTYFGNSGVDLFFVISGMIMVMTTAGGRQTPLGFLRNRFTRIAPLYWSITLAVFAIAVTAPGLLQSTTADPVQLLKSLAFVPFERADGAMHPTVFVGWTLNYEMAFYVLFAAGMLLPRALGLAATGAALTAAVLGGTLWPGGGPVVQFYLQPVVLEFGAGMALGALLPRLGVGPAWGWPAAGLGCAAFAVMLADAWWFPQTERALAFGVPAVVVVASAVVAERAGLRLGQAWIQLLGAASYATYLTHFFCTQAVVRLFERLHPGEALAYAGFPLAFALVALVGILAHLGLELPLTELARRCFAPQRPTARPAVAIRPEASPQGPAGG